jgi:hypothetical protein
VQVHRYVEQLVPDNGAARRRITAQDALRYLESSSKGGGDATGTDWDPSRPRGVAEQSAQRRMP